MGLLLAADPGGGSSAAVTLVLGLVSAAVTLTLGLLVYLRPTKDNEARSRADGAVTQASEAKILVQTAMEMARESKVDAERASERAGLCETRCRELERRLDDCDRHRSQLLAEAEGLAEIVNDKVLREEPPHGPT